MIKKLFVGLLLFAAIAASASDRIPIQSEVLKYRFQAIVNKRLLQNERLNSLQVAYAQLQREMEVTTTEIIKVRAELYASQELKETEYDIDADAGEFVKKAEGK